MNINDRELLARTLQAEAGNQGYGGMLAAGSVIMNRANASGYGDGLRGVILKPGQFSAWNSTTGYAGGEQGQDMANMRASDEAYKAADDLISGGYEDVTGGATHYYNPAISQPKWGQKAGGDWKQIGDHVFGFADAAKKPNPNQAIASDTMRVLGKQPKGLLATAQATDDTESKMIPEEKPKGLLGSLGIQKMVEGAEGEAGQRFFQRDTFKDTAAQMAPLLAAMGSSPALQKATAGIAAQRTEAKARNKTAEFLEKISPDAAELLRGGYLSASDALKISNDTRMQASAKAAGDAFRAGNMQEAMAILTEMSPTAMGQQIAAQAMKPPSEVMGSGKYTVSYPNGRSGEPVITVNEDVVAAEQRIRQAELADQRKAAGLPTDARKAEEADFSALKDYDNIVQDIGGIIDDFGYDEKTGKFTGPLNIGVGGFIEGAFGSIGVGGKGAVETAKAREEFDRFKTRLINASLRLNKGVQTEGDAQRSAAELGNARTESTAYAAIQELLMINQRARAAKEASIIERRQRFNLPEAQIPRPSTSPDLGWRVK